MTLRRFAIDGIIAALLATIFVVLQRRSSPCPPPRAVWAPESEWSVGT